LVTLDLVDQDRQRLQQEVLAQRRQAERLLVLLRVMVVLWKISGGSLNNLRFPVSGRLRLVAAIGQPRSVLPLRVALRIIGLSSSSYHAWKRDRPCALDEVSACPRSAPRGFEGILFRGSGGVPRTLQSGRCRKGI
jgi:hypothetical protein